MIQKFCLLSYPYGKAALMFGKKIELLFWSEKIIVKPTWKPSDKKQNG